MRRLLLAFMLTLVFAVPATAQDATQDGYSADGPQTIEQTAGQDRPGVAAGSGGGTRGSGPDGGASAELPFTGLDLLLIAGLGVGLLGVGLGMRRLTGPVEPDSASR